MVITVGWILVLHPEDTCLPMTCPLLAALCKVRLRPCHHRVDQCDVLRWECHLQCTVDPVDDSMDHQCAMMISIEDDLVEDLTDLEEEVVVDSEALDDLQEDVVDLHLREDHLDHLVVDHGICQCEEVDRLQMITSMTSMMNHQ